MFKKLVKVASLAAAGVVAYKVVEKQLKDGVAVIPVASEDIVEMLNAKDLNVLLGYDQKVVFIVNEDKSIAIQARLNDVNDVFLIEYLNVDANPDGFENVYPKSVIIENENSVKARDSFRRLLGSIGTSEERFVKFIKEVVKNPDLADLSI